jgi:hypothetical protein
MTKKNEYDILLMKKKRKFFKTISTLYRATERELEIDETEERWDDFLFGSDFPGPRGYTTLIVRDFS